MASPSRAQRRQKNARQAARANTNTPRPVESDLSDQQELEAAEAVVAAAPRVDLTPRPAARQARQTRKPIIRPTAEPVDYTQDYVVARSDLVKIAIWSVLLFGGMVILKFTGLV
ncbi:MAG: hypothetical protein SH847_18555 [Roseiflexaceae bacterium]|nr:hypothetical protein [Roseiflexaceae bacterium]